MTLGTFRRHYCHAQEEEITRALDHASVPVAVHGHKAGHQNPPAGEREATWIIACLLGNPSRYHEKPSFVTLASWGVDLTLFHLDGLACQKILY